MEFLSAMGVAGILFVIILVLIVISNAICKPTQGDDAITRMGNRASREIEQILFKLLSSLMLAFICVVGYAFYCLFAR